MKTSNRAKISHRHFHRKKVTLTSGKGYKWFQSKGTANERSWLWRFQHVSSAVSARRWFKPNIISILYSLVSMGLLLSREKF